MTRLLNRFGSEMAVLHHAAPDELASVVGTRLAEHIVAARDGSLLLQPGGGGRFGRVVASPRGAQLRLL